jgi:hypothetical protein
MGNQSDVLAIAMTLGVATQAIGCVEDPSTARDWVRALHGDPSWFAAIRSRNDMFGNLVLAGSEIATAVERAELEYRGPEAELWARRALGDRYAGAFVEGTSIVLLCAGCDAQAAREDCNMKRAWQRSMIVRHMRRPLHCERQSQHSPRS